MYVLHRLCLRFKAQGGGFLESYNVISSSIDKKVPYRKTNRQREICYFYDNIAPKHCSDGSYCGSEPLKLSDRIISTPNIEVTFIGWADPSPVPGKPQFASQIELFEISVHDVKSGGDDLISSTSNVINPINGSSPLLIKLPDTNPAMYEIQIDR